MTLRTQKLSSDSSGKMANYLKEQVELSQLINYYGSDKRKARAVWAVFGKGKFAGIEDGDLVLDATLRESLSGVDVNGYLDTTPARNVLDFLGHGANNKVLAESFRDVRAGGASIGEAAAELGMTEEQAWRLDLVMGGWAERCGGRMRRLGKLLGGETATAAEVGELSRALGRQAELDSLAERLEGLSRVVKPTARQRALMTKIRARFSSVQQSQKDLLASASERVREFGPAMVEESGELGLKMNELVSDLMDRRRARTETHAVDCTFSAPKSVSVLMALGDEDQADDIAAIQVESVRAALEQVFAEVGVGRRGKGGADKVRLERMRVALVTQLDSRAGATQPSLHTHSLLHLSALMEDGARSNIDTDILIKAAKNLGVYYHASLRSRMTKRFGVVWGETNGHGQSEMVDLPPEFLKRYSARGREMAEALPGFEKLSDEEKALWKEVGDSELKFEMAALKEAQGELMTDEELELAAKWAMRNDIEQRLYDGAAEGQRRVAQRISRDAKTAGMTEAVVREMTQKAWKTDGYPFESAVHGNLNRTTRQVKRVLRKFGKQAQVTLTDEVLKDWVAQVQDEKSFFTQSDVFLKVANETATMSVSEEDLLPLVHRAMKAAGCTVIRDSAMPGSWMSQVNDRGRLFVTPEHKLMEARLVDKFRRLTAEEVDIGMTDRSIYQLIKDRILTDGHMAEEEVATLEGQAQLVFNMLKGRSSVCRAAAGTGKSYAASVATPLLQRAGRIVIATAPSARAAADLAESTGADVAMNSTMLSLLLPGGRLAKRYDTVTAQKLANIDLLEQSGHVSAEQARSLRVETKAEGKQRKTHLEVRLWRQHSRLVSNLKEVKEKSGRDERFAEMNAWSVAEVAEDGRYLKVVKRGEGDRDGFRSVVAERYITCHDIAEETVAKLACAAGQVDEVRRVKRGSLEWVKGSSGHTGAIHFTDSVKSDGRLEELRNMVARAAASEDLLTAAEKEQLNKWRQEIRVREWAQKSRDGSARDQWVYVGKGVAEVVAAYRKGSKLDTEHPYFRLLSARAAALTGADMSDAQVAELASVTEELAWLSSTGQGTKVDRARVEQLARVMAQLDISETAALEKELGVVDVSEADVSLIFDEAGMAGTKNLDRVLQFMEPGQAQVTLLGDDKQVSPVKAAGGAFRFLADAKWSNTVEMTEVQRLREDVRKMPGVSPEREAEAQLEMRGLAKSSDMSYTEFVDAADQVAQTYMQMGRLTVTETRDEQVAKMMDTFKDALRHGETAVILSPDNHSVAALNDSFSSEQREWSAQVRAARADAEAGVDGAAEELDRLNAENTFEYNGVEHHLFREVGEEPIMINDFEYRCGEVLVCRTNPRRQEQLDIKNGHLVELVGRQPDGSLQVVSVETGVMETLSADSKALDGIHHGYASTVHRAQGGTYDRAIIDMSNPVGWNKEVLYVAATRGRYENRFFHVGEEKRARAEFADALMRSDTPEMAMAMEEQPEVSESPSKLRQEMDNAAQTLKENAERSLFGGDEDEQWKTSSRFRGLMDESVREAAAHCRDSRNEQDAKVKHRFDHSFAATSAADAEEDLAQSVANAQKQRNRQVATVSMDAALTMNRSS